MSTDKKTPTFSITDYLPVADPADSGEELDLSFGLDEDGNDSGEDDSSDADASSKDEGADEKDTGSEDEGKGEGDDAGDDKDDAGDEKSDADDGKKKTETGKGEDKKTKGPMVPKSRLDQVLAANRELKAQLAAREAAASKPDSKDGKDKAAEFDFDKAEEDYMNAVLEGRTADAKKIRKDIRAQEEARIEARVAEKTGTEDRQVRTREALAKATADIEREFPILNSDSKDYNKEIADEMIELYTGYVVAGKEPLDALSKALEVTVKMHDLVGDEKPAGDKTTPAKNLKDKIKASKQQPPATKRSETPKKQIDPDEIDVTKLSDDEWDALPESVKAKLRGDEF